MSAAGSPVGTPITRASDNASAAMSLHVVMPVDDRKFHAWESSANSARRAHVLTGFRLLPTPRHGKSFTVRRRNHWNEPREPATVRPIPRGGTAVTNVDKEAL